MAEFLLAVECGRFSGRQRFVNSTGSDVRSGPRVAAQGGLPRCTDLSILDLLERMYVICGRAHRCKVPITNTRVLVGIIILVAVCPNNTHLNYSRVTR